MAPPASPQDIQDRIAELLALPGSEFDYLKQLPREDAERLAAQIVHAVEERRHVILQALDDAARYLPGPLRRKLTQRIQGD